VSLSGYHIVPVWSQRDTIERTPMNRTVTGRNPFSASAQTLVTPLRTSALSVTRFHFDELGHERVVALPREDAHVLVFTLRDAPAHDFWLDGKISPAGPSARNTFNIIDLNAAPASRLTHPFDSLHFHIPRGALAELSEEAGTPGVTELRTDAGWNTYDPIVEQLQRYILSALEEPERGNRLFIDHLILALHAHVVSTYGGIRPYLPPHRGGLAPWQEKRAKEVIAANLGKDVSLPQIADECGLSTAHFSRAFKASTGSTPHGWLQARRVEQAKDLLLKPGPSLGDIAMACGFADQSHFTRIFRRLAHTTPGAWRRLRRTS
jgi:AraC family transcriptional regulator